MATQDTTHPRQGRAGRPHRSDQGATLGGTTKRERGKIIALDHNYSTMIPSPTEFDGNDFLYTAGLQEMGMGLISQWPELQFLADFEIRFLWKAKGGKSGGNMTMGKCVLASGLVEHFSGVDWIVWLGADNCRMAELNDEGVEAVVYHELLHCDLTGEEADNPAVRGHDFEGFAKEIERYGFPGSGLQIARSAVQARLALDANP